MSFCEDSSSLDLSFDDDDLFLAQFQVTKRVEQPSVTHPDDNKENSGLNEERIFLDSEPDFHLRLSATETQNLDSVCREVSSNDSQRGIKRQVSEPESKDLLRPEKSQKCHNELSESTSLLNTCPESQSPAGQQIPESGKCLEDEPDVSIDNCPEKVEIISKTIDVFDTTAIFYEKSSEPKPEIVGSQSSCRSPPYEQSATHYHGDKQQDVIASTSSNGYLDTSLPSPEATRAVKICFESSERTAAHKDLDWQEDSVLSTSPDNELDTLPPLPEASQPFKIPSEMALVCVTVRASEVNKLTRFIGGLTDQKMFVQCGKASEMQNFFSKITSFYEASKRRISDVSSLSSHSRISSATGYSGDVGSIGSTITSDSSNASSKRDRHSLCPEIAIEKHNIVSPLPKLASRFLQSLNKTNEKKTALGSIPLNLDIVDSDIELKKTNDEENPDAKEADQIENQASGKSENNNVDPSPIESKQRSKKLLSKQARDAMSKLKSYSDQIENVACSHPDQFQVSTRVFAKWTERSDIRYWPGKVGSINDDKYTVLFDDGFSRKLKEEDLIRVDALKPGFKVNVTVEQDEGIYQVASIVSHPDLSIGKSSQADLSYMVEFAPFENVSKPETKLVSSSLIHLSDNQAKEIKLDLGGRYTMPRMSMGDLSLDNLVSTPRRNRNSTPAKALKVSLKKDIKRKKGGDNAETSVNEENETSSSECIPSRDQAQKDSVSTEDEALCGSTKKNRKKNKSGGTLFEGLVFILTQSKVKSEQFSESAMESETEEESCLESISALSFDKKEIRGILEKNGGCVLKEFPGTKQKIPEEIILISDKHCLTMNYLSCVAYGFKLINFTWVLNCAATKTRLPLKSYFLAVGNSTLLNREVEQKEIGNLRNLFKDTHLLLASVKKEFIHDWKPLVSRLGASTSSRSSGTLDKSLSAVDIVIGDTVMPPSLVKDVRSKRIPVVSSLWIIQSIINGRRVPFGNFLLFQE